LLGFSNQSLNFSPFKSLSKLIQEERFHKSLGYDTTVGLKHKSVDEKHKGVYSTVETKPVRKNSFSPPIIEDWNSDDEIEIEIKPKVEFDHLHYVCDQRVVRLVWNNTSRVNHKNIANKVTHLYPKSRLVPQVVLTKSGKLKTAGTPVNTVRPVYSADSKTTMNYSRPISNVYKRGHSQVRRSFNKYSPYKTSIFNKQVNNVRVKDSICRERAVVSGNIGKEVNAIKASACWVLKSKHSSASNTFKKYSYIDAQGNKCYITEYEDYNGGFVSFGDDKGRISGKVNTACYVLNRALVTNSQNKSPYELIHGRPPLIDFMKPFGCHVTILNTMDNLRKFDGKANEGYFVGYYVVSKAMKVFNKRNRIVEETLNIRFLENAPNVKGNGPNWIFDIDSLTVSKNYVPVIAGNQTNDIAGIRDNLVAGQDEKKKELAQEYILIPICITDLLISQDLNNSIADNGKKATEVNKSRVSDNGGQDDQVTRSEFERLLQQERQTEHLNNTNSFNNVSLPISTDGSLFVNVALPSPINGVATPASTNAFEEHPFERFYTFKNAFSLPHVPTVTLINDTGIFIQDFQNSLFACYLSQKELKKPVQALKDLSWVEEMQDELLQFKLLKVWTLVDLPSDKHTQEEGIDYDEVFAPVARIEAIRLFMAYASFKDFVVYQMDVKSDFLYGKIEEEVYVCQPSGFEDSYFPDKVYKTVSTPMEPNKTLIKDEEAEDVDVHIYRSMIGSLMYLTASRPNITFSMYVCARFQITPKTSHLHVVKRIFRYLKGQPNLGLWYPKDLPFDLESFSDSDYAEASLDRKSTTRGCQFLCKRLISWQYKKQTIVSNSTTEAEYVAAANCCGQFWNTATSKTVNSVKQIHVIVDGKAVVISESSVRSDLLFNDEDGIACRTNAEIFENLALIGYEQISTKLTFQKDLGVDEAVHKEGGNSVERDITTDARLVAAQGNTQTRFETASKKSHDPPLSEVNTFGSGEDRMEYPYDLTDFVPPTPYDSPLLGGHTPGSDEAKTTQDKVITRLKLRVKRLEKKIKARSLQPMKRRLFKRRVETFTDKSLGEDASKQERNNDKTEELNLTDGADTEVIVEDKGSGEKGGSTANQVSTARPEVSTASVSVNVSAATPSTLHTTTTIFGDEDLTIAQTLIKLRSEKAKVKGVAFRDVEEPLRLTRLTTTLPHLLTIDPKDKAQRIYEEEFAKFDRAQMEKQKQEEATSATLTEEFDEIQARIDADLELAIRMTHEKQEKYTIKESARLLAEYFERRMKQLAAERAATIRNKPPTRTQVRNMMITYLKHMGKYTYQKLKHKTLEELQKLYPKEQKRTNDFVPMNSEKEENKSMEPESEGKKGKRIKRVAYSVLKQKSFKKQKMMQEQEYAKKTVDPEILSTKYPIVDLESQNLGDVNMEDLHVYKIIKANRNTSYYKFFSMMRKFDTQDLVDLHRLVMKKFKGNTPKGYNLLLWGDLKVMFEPNAEDEIWSNQQDWNLISWKLYENYRVHTLLMDTLNCFNMLVEKRYPLIKEMLEKMLNWKLEVEAESTMTFELLKFIKS
nr:uncharacterized mitochondrial protein AtMg00810-like [Tanacetum cinerariifolium]